MGTLVVLLLLLAVVAGIIYSLIRQKKTGKSCCSGCSGACSMCNGCCAPEEEKID